MDAAGRQDEGEEDRIDKDWITGGEQEKRRGKDI